jgi:hypothetical protein
MNLLVKFPYTIKNAIGVVPGDGVTFSAIDVRLVNKNLLRIDYIHQCSAFTFM